MSSETKKGELKKLCRGCREDFYNHGNHSTTGECWLLAKAKIVLRTRVGVWQNPPYAWVPRETLNCHSPDGERWIESTDPRLMANWKEPLE